MIVWLIGLSDSGKTTIACAMAEQLRDSGQHCIILDGDELRDVWDDVSGHSVDQRRRNHQRISRLCKFLERQLSHGPTTHLLVPALSIFPDLREWNRREFAHYFEVFLDLPLAHAERRDSKGHYAAARAGKLTDVVGIDIPFPAPEKPDLHIGMPVIEQSPDVIAAQVLSAMGVSA